MHVLRDQTRTVPQTKLPILFLFLMLKSPSKRDVAGTPQTKICQRLVSVVMLMYVYITHSISQISQERNICAKIFCLILFFFLDLSSVVSFFSSIAEIGTSKISLSEYIVSMSGITSPFSHLEIALSE